MGKLLQLCNKKSFQQYVHMTNSSSDFVIYSCCHLLLQTQTHTTYARLNIYVIYIDTSLMVYCEICTGYWHTKRFFAYI
jgi:hypothetical protein